MFSLMIRNWRALALRGAIATIFGIVLVALPGITLQAFVILFGIFALAFGVIAIYAALRDRRADERWWMLFLEGLLGIAIGIGTFIYPEVTALVLLYFVAAWAILTGIFEIIAAVQLRQAIENEWLLAMAGVLSILFGLLLLISPGAGALTIVWLIGVYAITVGLLQFIQAVRLRTLQQSLR